MVTPKPVVTGDASFTYNRTDAKGFGSITVSDGAGLSTAYRVKPTPPVSIGTQTFSTAYRLAAAGATPSYTYDLAFQSDRVVSNQMHRVTATQVATLRSRYDYLCTATRGYDGPTGLGSPRGTSAL